MTLIQVLYMLLGAALVAVGIFAAALADRIRGIRLTRQAHARTLADNEMPRFVAPVSAPTKPRARAAVKSSPSPADTIFVPDSPAAVSTNGKRQSAEADDVIAALVLAGYKRPVATEAVWSCGQTERATVESWAGAALRRCAREGLS